MKELILVGGHVVYLDEDDYERLSIYNWRISNRGYPVGKGGIDMHRLILPHIDGFEIDHINRNKLDNRRENLRYVTHKENMQNYIPVAWTKTSKYNGVFKESASGQWRVNVRVGNKKIYVGRFKDEIDAAIAFDMKCIEIRGKKAKCNFLNPE